MVTQNEDDDQLTIAYIKEEDSGIFMLSSQYRDSMLCYASYTNNLTILKLCLREKTNIHVRDDIPIRGASKHGHLRVVKLLVRHGANTGEAKKLALEKGNYDVVAFLHWSEHCRRIIQEFMIHYAYRPGGAIYKRLFSDFESLKRIVKVKWLYYLHLQKAILK